MIIALMPGDDLAEIVQVERRGAAADASQAALAYYREAQLLLLPAGAVWPGREAYDRRMEAFERIQQKIYRLQPSTPEAAPPTGFGPAAGAFAAPGARAAGLQVHTRVDRSGLSGFHRL